MRIFRKSRSTHDEAPASKHGGNRTCEKSTALDDELNSRQAWTGEEQGEEIKHTLQLDGDLGFYRHNMPATRHQRQSSSLISFDAVMHDIQLQSIYCQFLAETNPKLSARLLFIISVEDFRSLFPTENATKSRSRLLGSKPPSLLRSRLSAASSDSTILAAASRIVAKFLTPKALFDICGEDLRIDSYTGYKVGMEVRKMIDLSLQRRDVRSKETGVDCQPGPQCSNVGVAHSTNRRDICHDKYGPEAPSAELRTDSAGSITLGSSVFDAAESAARESLKDNYNDFVTATPYYNQILELVTDEAMVEDLSVSPSLETPGPSVLNSSPISVKKGFRGCPLPWSCLEQEDMLEADRSRPEQNRHQAAIPSSASSLSPHQYEAHHQQQRSVMPRLEAVLKSERLTCLFWTHLYVENCHHVLSYWVEVESMLKPLAAMVQKEADRVSSILHCHQANDDDDSFLNDQSGCPGSNAASQPVVWDVLDKFWEEAKVIIFKFVAKGAPLQLPMISVGDVEAMDQIEMYLAAYGGAYSPSDNLFLCPFSTQRFPQMESRQSHWQEFLQKARISLKMYRLMEALQISSVQDQTGQSLLLSNVLSLTSHYHHHQLSKSHSSPPLTSLSSSTSTVSCSSQMSAPKTYHSRAFSYRSLFLGHVRGGSSITTVPLLEALQAKGITAHAPQKLHNPVLALSNHIASPIAAVIVFRLKPETIHRLMQGAEAGRERPPSKVTLSIADFEVTYLDVKPKRASDISSCLPASSHPLHTRVDGDMGSYQDSTTSPNQEDVEDAFHLPEQISAFFVPSGMGLRWEETTARVPASPSLSSMPRNQGLDQTNKRPSATSNLKSSKVRPRPLLFNLTLGSYDQCCHAAVLTRYCHVGSLASHRTLSNTSPPFSMSESRYVYSRYNGSSKTPDSTQVRSLDAFAPAGICVISRYPLVMELRSRLKKLHQAAVSTENGSCARKNQTSSDEGSATREIPLEVADCSKSSSVHPENTQEISSKYLDNLSWMPTEQMIADLVTPFTAAMPAPDAANDNAPQKRHGKFACENSLCDHSPGCLHLSTSNGNKRTECQKQDTTGQQSQNNNTPEEPETSPKKFVASQEAFDRPSGGLGTSTEHLAPWDVEDSKGGHPRGPPLPLLDFSIESLFACLDIDHVVRLFACLLLEKKIILLSSRYTILTTVAESLRALLSPMVWSHIFVPILPKSMLAYVHCPTPYLFGVYASEATESTDSCKSSATSARNQGPSSKACHSQQNPELLNLLFAARSSAGGETGESEDDIVLVNLDRNRMSKTHHNIVTQDAAPTFARLRSDLVAALRPQVVLADSVDAEEVDLERAGVPSAHARNHNETQHSTHLTPSTTPIQKESGDLTRLHQSCSSYTTVNPATFPDDKIRNIFREWMDSLLQHCEKATVMLRDGKESAVVFDEDVFLRLQDPSSTPFFKQLCHTQAFHQHLSHLGFQRVQRQMP